MRYTTRWMAIAPLLIAVSGCGSGYYYDRNSEYAEAQMSEPLTLPPTRDRMRSRNAMPVPDTRNDFIAERGGFEPPRPQSLSTSDSRRSFVENRRADGSRWLVVGAAPGNIWPRLQQFVQQSGYNVQSIDGDRGRIVTDRGVISLRQGIRGNTTDVYCQQGSASVDGCLDAISAYLSASAPDSGVSLVAQNLSRNDRVQLESRDDRWQLALALDFPRAWAEMAWQLENNYETGGRRLIDQNRSERVFTIDYTVEGEGSWVPFMGEADRTGEYRLHVEPSSGGVLVTVTDSSDQPVDPRVAREILDSVASTLR
ncbi:outer membrane protein assembly factor BamC [Kushneria aurantia]|uniref:Outer membrane protein assembly factor BamC n=1 Tax=Kushneria aurantia TaxID=504092 RepID=A0ABV6G2F7_9GAMM|nr:outer membrane protein assembly factor BamC [Kushneria aurantia]